MIKCNRLNRKCLVKITRWIAYFKVMQNIDFRAFFIKKNEKVSYCEYKVWNRKILLLVDNVLWWPKRWITLVGWPLRQEFLVILLKTVVRWDKRNKRDMALFEKFVLNKFSSFYNFVNTRKYAYTGAWLFSAYQGLQNFDRLCTSLSWRFEIWYELISNGLTK